MDTETDSRMADPTTVRPPLPTSGRSAKDLARGLNRIDWRRYVIYIAFVAVFVLFAVLLRDDGFLSQSNLLNIFRQTATITVIAVGMTYVIACAEIDLSVGSVAGLASVCSAMAIAHYGLVAGILAGLAVGVVVGTINGGLVSRLGIPSFLVTLGMLGIAAGVAQWITKSAPQPILNDTFNLAFGGGDFGPVPGLLIWTAVFVIAGAVVLNRTRFGRQIVATGGSRTAADFTGINTRRIKFQVLLISATVASVAGMLYAGRLQSGRFQWGAGDELSAIAAVILGGTSLFGGRGTVVGTLFGALLIGLINNGLILAGLESSQQQVVRGVIIILAVALARKK
ncbi:ABC transporter permease [Kribbella shirazensis]|uniref:Ribose transport system permease protein n=1 Tax=Kribbella shirazensis TaxID=1105143 RepID=A0A7X6A103_9ACTN|nr:ABC transporter permease [Kribbella shirazensis]NIK57335.1 ribose transport system permease protein [Kribbella shirazensis]